MPLVFIHSDILGELDSPAKEEGVQRLHPLFLGSPCGQERLLRGETGQLQNIRQNEEQTRGNGHTEKEQYQVLASNLLTSNNYSFSLNAIPMQAGEVVTDIYFDFGKVPVGFQSVVNPTLSVMVNGNAVNGYQMVNRADVGGKYQGTWQTATASWVTIIRRLWNTPTLPKTGY